MNSKINIYIIGDKVKLFVRFDCQTNNLVAKLILTAGLRHFIILHTSLSPLRLWNPSLWKHFHHTSTLKQVKFTLRPP